MKDFFRTFLAVILAQIFLFGGVLIVTVAIAAVAISRPADVPRDAYLVQRLSGEIPEFQPPTPVSLFGPKADHLTAILENLEKARVDDRIRGVILEVGGSDLGFAKRDEIRHRIRQLQDAGRPVYAFGRFLTTLDYYMVSGCDSILLPPEGVLELKGLAAEIPFFKGTLDAVGVKPNLDYIAEYKSAVEPFLRERMSEANRKNLRWLLEPLFADLVATLAQERGMSADGIRSLMERAFFNAPEALESGLVDAVLYWEDLEGILGTGGEWKTISGDEYAKVKRSEAGLSGKKRIAVVHAQGLIAGGENGFVFPFGLKMGAGTITRTLSDVREDEGIAGMVLRIDSPGGESIASDEIGYALHQVDREKPAVVSMVDVAGSGGYMIAYQCSTIVAHPHTLTGSIGSIVGKFNLRGLYDHLGITKDFVAVGPRARIHSDYQDFTEEEWEIVRDRHRASYESWTRRIAEMRGLEPAALDTLGRGRVWTGEQALSRRLVDHLGGLDEALAEVKAQLGLAPDAEVEIVHLPKPKSFLEKLLEEGSLARAWGAALLHLAVHWVRGEPPEAFPAVTMSGVLEWAHPSLLENALLLRIH